MSHLRERVCFGVSQDKQVYYMMEIHLVLYFFLFVGIHSVAIDKDERKDVVDSKDTSRKQYLEMLIYNISNYENSKSDSTSSYIPESDFPKFDASQSDFPKFDAAMSDFQKYDIERNEAMEMAQDIDEMNAKMDEDFSKAWEEAVRKKEEAIRKKEEAKKEKYMVKFIIALVAVSLFGVVYCVEKFFLKCTKRTKSDDEEKILDSSQSGSVQTGSSAPQGV